MENFNITFICMGVCTGSLLAISISLARIAGTYMGRRENN